MESKTIGYIWLGCDIEENNETKLKIWFGVCKHTKKVSCMGLLPFYPIMVSSTSITDNECFDGKYCLDTECEYCTSKSFENSLSRQGLDEVFTENPEKVTEWMKKNIEFIYENLDDETLEESCTNESIESTTVIEDFMSMSVGD